MAGFFAPFSLTPPSQHVNNPTLTRVSHMDPQPQLPPPGAPQDKSAMGKARAWAEKSNGFYQDHLIEICCVIALLSVLIVMLTPN
jgi:hypothetical protein